MRWHYDTSRYYGYVCLSDCDRDFIQVLTRALESEGVNILRLYENPAFPAEDGIRYEKLIRVGFSDRESQTMHEKTTIERAIRSAIESSRDGRECEKGRGRGDAADNSRYETLVNTYSTVVQESIRSVEEKLSDRISEATLPLLNEFAEIRAALDIQNAELLDMRSLFAKEACNDDAQDQGSRARELDLREQELKRRVEALEDREGALVEREASLRKRQESIDTQMAEFFKQVQEHSQGLKPVDASEKLVRVLVFGVSKLSAPDVQACLENTWMVRGDVDIDVEAVVSEDDRKLARARAVVDKLISGAYDYLLCGPQPHSVNGKNGKKTWQAICESKGLSTLVLSNFTSPICKSMLEGWVKEILKHRGLNGFQTN